MASGEGTKWSSVINKVDLRGVKLGSQAWAEARTTVTASMEAVGAILVTHDALGADLRQVLFDGMPEFFALPLDVKRSLISGYINGYIERSPSSNMPAYESVRIWETTDGGGSRNLVDDVVWPHVNPKFWNTVGTFAKNMMDLERTVRTMILEGLGVQQEHIDAQHESIVHSVRQSRYGTLPEMRTTSLSMLPHRDNGMLNVVVQHQVEGLEVQTKDGSWIMVPPDPDTVAVIAGEMLTVATNGRVPACVHRVRTPSNRKRFSVLLSSKPKDGVTVRPLDELVDAYHPLQYNPCNFSEYIDFRYAKSVVGGDLISVDGTLKAFCGKVLILDM
ncbi:hypothetical protein QOZ80_8BG0659080 [Eleusine coracana subsp. coracana]|nr:hypothetical protein QOZ80_8BG0659080 [Eleusine coracana subsp. coracana]